MFLTEFARDESKADWKALKDLYKLNPCLAVNCVCAEDMAYLDLGLK